MVRGRRYEVLESIHDVRGVQQGGCLMGKWLAGIPAGVIIGTVIWFLTHQGGPFNRIPPPSPPPEPKPKVVITDFQVDSVVVLNSPNKTTNARFTVYNEGDVTAQECRISWHSHGSAFAGLETPIFSFPPKATRSFSVQSFIYKEPGTFDSFAYVKCSNDKTENLHRQISVIRLP